MTKREINLLLEVIIGIKLDPSMKWEIARYDTNGNFNTTLILACQHP